MNLINQIKSNYKLLLKIMFVGQWFTTKEFTLILLQNIIIYLYILFLVHTYVKHEYNLLEWLSTSLSRQDASQWPGELWIMRSAKVGKCCKLGLQFQDGTDIRTHCGEEATMGGSVTAFNSFCGGGASLTLNLISV